VFQYVSAGSEWAGPIYTALIDLSHIAHIDISKKERRTGKKRKSMI